MNGSPPEARPAVGLAESEKVKTRAALRHEALRLPRERGNGAATVEQIAEAAEGMAITLFRRFASKEDLTLTDDFDPLIVEACRAQPAALSPVADRARY